MRYPITALAAAVSLATGNPLAAEVVEQDRSGFITKDEAVVSATPKEVWLALITPSTWWNASHTWSGDSANLTLRPQAGGCFCERIPEAEEEDRITLEGSVEHMRVVQSYPEAALRMTGGLGPLQSEAVNGVLTIAISQVDDGTRIVWEYHVAGRMRYEMDVISKAVDGVMTEQLNGLASLLGRLDEPAEEAPEEAGEADGAIEPEAVIDEEAGGEGPSVEDAFGDLSDEG